MRTILPAIALAGLTACAASSAAVPGNAPQGVTALQRCNPTVLAKFIGQPRSNAVGRRMRRATGAKVIRWVPVGMLVNMIYQYDRLTVRLGGDHRITQASCN